MGEQNRCSRLTTSSIRACRLRLVTVNLESWAIVHSASGIEDRATVVAIIAIVRIGKRIPVGWSG
jgi:hypothetical protein